MKSKQKPAAVNHGAPSLWKKWFTAISTLFVLSFFAMTFAGMLYLLFFGETVPFGNVAVIKVQGVILTESPKGAFATPAASSEDIVKFLKDAEKDEGIKAILLDINSPGGSAVASAEIANQVIKTKAKKPVISVIREAGASGAYWIASATDKIWANPLSSTGSIGVISSYLEFAGLIDRYNVTYQRLVYGKYKDAGSPFRKLTREERNIIQDKLDKVGMAFVETVAKNRNLSKDTVLDYATGMVFLGSEAKEMKLVDELGTREDAVEHLEKTLNITAKLTEYQKVPGILEVLSGATSQVPSWMAQPNPLYYDTLALQAVAPTDPTFYT